MEATLDKLTTQVENAISFYSANLDQLYRLVIGLALMSYLYSAVLQLWVIAKFQAIDVAPEVILPLVMGLSYCAIMTLLALITRKRLREKSPGAVTLFAVFIVLNLGAFHVVVFVFGLCALFNAKFRAAMLPTAPEWYRKLNASFD